jgi:hypothetical protein
MSFIPGVVYFLVLPAVRSQSIFTFRMFQPSKRSHIHSVSILERMRFSKHYHLQRTHAPRMFHGQLFDYKSTLFHTKCTTIIQSTCLQLTTPKRRPARILVPSLSPGLPEFVSGCLLLRIIIATCIFKLYTTTSALMTRKAVSVACWTSRTRARIPYE